VGDRYASLGEDQLHVAQAQAEDVVEPHGVADDLSREAVTRVGRGLWRHLTSMAQPFHSGKRPPSWQCLATHPSGAPTILHALFWVSTAKLNLEQGAPVQELLLADGQIYSGDVSSQFRPATPFKFMPADSS